MAMLRACARDAQRWWYTPAMFTDAAIYLIAFCLRWLILLRHDFWLLMPLSPCCFSIIFDWLISSRYFSFDALFAITYERYFMPYLLRHDAFLTLCLRRLPYCWLLMPYYLLIVFAWFIYAAILPFDLFDWLFSLSLISFSALFFFMLMFLLIIAFFFISIFYYFFHFSCHYLPYTPLRYIIFAINRQWIYTTEHTEYNNIRLFSLRCYYYWCFRHCFDADTSFSSIDYFFFFVSLFHYCRCLWFLFSSSFSFHWLRFAALLLNINIHLRHIHTHTIHKIHYLFIDAAFIFAADYAFASLISLMPCHAFCFDASCHCHDAMLSLLTFHFAAAFIFDIASIRFSRRWLRRFIFAFFRLFRCWCLLLPYFDDYFHWFSIIDFLRCRHAAAMMLISHFFLDD